MNIQQLTYIVEIAKMQQHFPRGRVSLCFAACSVPADPESGKELGYCVFRRTRKGLELTEKGNLFYQKAQKMLEDWSRFKEEVISGTEHKN